MGNYTTLELEVLIKKGIPGEWEIQALDQWLKTAVIYNPAITLDWSYNAEADVYRFIKGREMTLPVYPGSRHLFFFNRDARDLIGLHEADTRDTPVWSYDESSRILSINAYFKNRHGALSLFLDWLSPLVEKVIDGEFNTQDDLEGPRHVEFVNNVLEIGQYSFTR